ncbi:hypothetical protein ACFLUA_02190 [Chloroflexota bacterium]
MDIWCMMPEHFNEVSCIGTAIHSRLTALQIGCVRAATIRAVIIWPFSIKVALQTVSFAKTGIFERALVKAMIC